MAASFNKKDPAVIEHVEAAVNKAVAAATKAERTRALNIIKDYATDNKENTSDKVMRVHGANLLKFVANDIKNIEAAK